MDGVTIEDAKQVQRDLHLLDSHVIYVDIDSDWFVIAHTDAERENQLMISLTQCVLHQYLMTGNLDHKLCCAGYQDHEPRWVFPASGWYQVPSSSLHEVRGLAL